MNVVSYFDGISCGQVALFKAGIKVDNYFAYEIDKHAIKITQINFPNSKQMGNVLDVDFDILPKIDLLMGGSPCFVSDTPILCKDSLKPINEIKVGDYVLTHNNRYREVVRIGGDTKQIYKLSSQGNTPTFTTDNHPYYVRDRNRVYNKTNGSYEWIFGDPKWIEVKDIKKSHYVGTPILKHSENPLNLSEEECYVLGLYIGDGHTRKDYRTTEGRGSDRYYQLIISVGSHERNKFIESVSLKHSLYKHSKSVHRAVFSNKRLVEISEKYCGVGSEHKVFSKMLIDLPPHLLKKVIDGYEFSDGSFREQTYRATTVSKKLVESLSIAIAKVYNTTCCIEFTKRPNKRVIEGRVVNQKDTYTISYRKNHPKQSRAWVIDDIVWNPVKEVVDMNITKKVFNIEVDEDNSYVSNNRIVHNCQGFSFSGKQLNFEDPRSKLFFEFVKALKELKPKYWLLENVVMKQEYQDVISGYLGVEPQKLNSTKTSAQNRVRLYWANFEITEPTDQGIKLEDILEHTEFIGPGAIRGRRLNKATILGRRLDDRGKRQDYDKTIPITQCLEVRATNTDKSNCLTTVAKDTVLTPMPIGRHPDAFNKKLPYRNYTRVERCRLMNLPDNYCNEISLNQTVKATGNGWDVGMVTHIFKNLGK